MTKEYLERQFKNYHEITGDVVTPEMFGAKGDGVTDDSVAFNNMILALNASTYQYRHIKLTKLYYLANKVTIPTWSDTIRNILIEGSCTSVVAASDSEQKTFSQNIIAEGGFEINDSVTFKNVGFVNYGVQVKGAGVVFDGCDFVSCATAIDLYVHDTRTWWVGELYVKNCYFAYCPIGINSRTNITANNNFFKDSEISGCTVKQGGGTFLQGRIAGWRIHNNHIYTINPIVVTSVNSLISNNFFDTNDVALEITSSGVNSIVGNMFYKEQTTLDVGNNPNPVCKIYGSANTMRTLFNNNFTPKAVDASYPNEYFVDVDGYGGIEYADDVCYIQFINIGANITKIAVPSSSDMVEFTAQELSTMW